MRQAAIRHGTNGGGNAPVLNSTIRAESLWQSLNRSQADRAAPVVREQRRAGQIESLDDFAQVVDPLLKRVVVVLRLVRQAAADVIDGDAAIAITQAENQVPPVKRPGRIAVDEQQRLAGAFIDVVQPVRAEA